MLLSGPPPLIHARYRLVEWLGKGNMGVVYRAHDEALDRPVVIKFLDPGPDATERSARFLREARSVARLSHPNIISIYDLGEQEGWTYLVLEHISGGDVHTLRQRLGGRLPVSEVLEVGRSILQALSYAHTAGIIHRDIKPENILVTTDRHFKLADFSLARSQRDQRLTQDGALVGTVLYMAPEVLSGMASEPRADLYSLGVVLYELLAGRPPYEGETLGTVITRILNAPLEPPRVFNAEIPPALEGVILRLMARDARQRYPDAETVLADAIFAAQVDMPAPFLQQKHSTSIGFEPESSQGNAVESERRRLAGQLQSSVIEPVNLLISQAANFEQTLPAQSTARLAMNVISTLARQVLQQARDLEASLHPAVLESLGLEAALDALATQVERTQGVHILLQVERLATRLPAQLELALFRLVQDLVEALPEIFISKAEITLRSQENHLQLDLGYPSTTALPESTLRSVRARLAAFSGESEVKHLPQGRTLLACRLPLRTAQQFTPRELEVLQCLVEGLSNKEIASRMVISPRTVNYHLDHIYAKLGVNSRTEAALIALRQGWARRASQIAADPG